MGTKSKSAGGARTNKKLQTPSKILEELTPKQLEILNKKLSSIKKLEQEFVNLKSSKLGTNSKELKIETAVFQNPDDWKIWSGTTSQPFRAQRLSWEMLRKAVGEEDKYQSKKNWSSTKGKGMRKDPMAKRLNLYDLKLFGVNPLEQYPFLVVCDSCGNSVNAPFLKFHQEIDCKVSDPKKDDRRGLVGRMKDKSDANSLKRNHSELMNGDDTHFPDSKEAGGTKTLKKSRTKQDNSSFDKDSGTGTGGGNNSVNSNSLGNSKGTSKGGSKSKRSSKASAAAKSAPKPKAVEFDLDKQCGVVAPPSNKQCTRSLTCKAHSMAMKRAVRGRSQPFDTLLQAHLAKSRNAKHTRANDHSSAVRRAAAMAIGDHGATFLTALLDEVSDSEAHDTESETENIVSRAAAYRTKPLATKVNFMPRKRQHYLRIHDLFLDALRPSGMHHDGAGKGGVGGAGASASIGGTSGSGGKSVFSVAMGGARGSDIGSGSGGGGGGGSVPFTSVASVATVHSNPSIAAMMSTLRMAVGNRNPLGNRLSTPSLPHHLNSNQ